MGKHNESKKRVLASLVMGLNCVNSFAPMAVAVNVQPENVPAKHVKETVAEAEQYTAACYQALDVVDNAVFGTAEAHFTEIADDVSDEIIETSALPSGTGFYSVQTVNGVASNCIVKNGGTQHLAIGLTEGTSVSNGGVQLVTYALFGIVGATETYIYDGGVQKVYEQGVATSTVISNGGIQDVSCNSGFAGFTSIFAGGTQDVKTGFVSSTYIYNGGVQNISGGSANVTFLSGGTQNVSGGTVSNTSISNGGVQNVSGGTISQVSIFSSGVQNVRNGGSVSKITLFNGAVQNVSGGVASSTIISNGGIQNISGGSVDNTEISSGGIMNVRGGIAEFTRISNGGMQNVSGGTANNNFMYSGAVQNVRGGLAFGTDMSAGAVQNVSGGTARLNYVSNGTVQNISGGFTDITWVYDGGVQNVSGGTAKNNIVLYGGVQNVSSGLVQSTSLGYYGDGGTQNVSGGIVEDTVIEKTGVQNISNGSVKRTNILSGGVQNVSGGTVSVTDVSSGGTQVVDGGIVKDTTVEAGGIEILHAGDVKGTVLNGGITEVHNDAIDFGDLTMNDGIVRFGADGGNYNITGNFVFAGGLVDMMSNPDGHNPNPRTYETLTIANLTGNDGTFKLDTDLDKAVYGSETTNGDKIVINGGITGTHYIQVADESLYTGAEITGDRKLLLVTDNSGVQDLVMEGKDLNNGGVWHTLPPQLFKEGNNWYIGYVQKEASNDTTVYLTDRQVAVYNQWTRISNDSLRKRLGDLRYNDAEAGVWARYYSGKLSGTGYDQSYHTYQVGFDKTNGNNTFGIALERQESNQSYTYGNGEGTTNAGNIYFTNYSDTGSFFDAILKYGKMNSKYSTIGTFPDSADYDTPAYSLSLEYGKTNTYKDGFFVEPKVQFTYGRVGSQTYTTNRGTIIEEEAIKSLIGNVGFAAGRKVGDSDYYFKAGIFREFKGERDVHLAAANGENMYRSENYGDTWFELGLGGNVKLGKNTHVYGDVEKSFGADIQKKWQVNAGVRWEF